MIQRSFSKSIFALALCALIVSFSNYASAADAVVVEPAPMGALPLNIGNWEVAGSASYSRNVRTNDRTFSISPKVEYFFLNRFSAGGTLAYSDEVNAAANINGTTYGLGPSATFYITHTSNTALSIDQSVIWQKPVGGGNYVQGATGLAFDFFLTPSIAFGPSLRAYYYFNGDINKPDDRIRLGFDFSIFL